MKAIDFEEKNKDIGADQPEYLTLPAKIIIENEVRVFSKWEPSKEDLERLNNGGHIWLCQTTGGNKYQPITLSTTKPNFKAIDKEADRKLTENLDIQVKQKSTDKILLNSDQVKQLRSKLKKNKHGNK